MRCFASSVQRPLSCRSERSGAVITMSITYQETTDAIGPGGLQGFFVGWPNRPSPETHLKILEGSDHCILARSANRKVVGFITAISDGISCAHIPHLEVLPEWQGHGIGTELVRRMVAKLKELYAIDLVCDDDARGFYERLGFRAGRGMMIRNYHRQRCD